MKPESKTAQILIYSAAGVIARLLVVGSVAVVQSFTPFLPILWFLIGAFLMLGAYVLAKGGSSANGLLAYLCGMAISTLLVQELMWGHILVTAFKAAAFLLPAFAGIAAFIMIWLARRNA